MTGGINQTAPTISRPFINYQLDFIFALLFLHLGHIYTSITFGYQTRRVKLTDQSRRVEIADLK